MKPDNIIFFLLLLLMPLNASAVPDSLQTAALDAKLAEYFRAMERESLPVQMQECDFIIESAQEPELRQVIAEKVYDHYMESKLMGAEGVAVHVFDKWFAGGKLKMGDEIKQLNARVYADFNRSSLLGCKAPDLRMQTLQGDSLTVFPSGDKRFKVLYFYDVDCAKCKVQTILLRNQLNTSNYPLDFYAIYVGDNKSLWEKYAADHLNVSTPATSTHHLWDAELSSDFQRKYGVLQSPRLFLVNPADAFAALLPDNAPNISENSVIIIKIIPVCLMTLMFPAVTPRSMITDIRKGINTSKITSQVTKRGASIEGSLYSPTFFKSFLIIFHTPFVKCHIPF